MEIKLDYDTLPHGQTALCEQCASIIDSEQSYYFNANDKICDLYFDHPSCVELYYLKQNNEVQNDI